MQSVAECCAVAAAVVLCGYGGGGGGSPLVLFGLLFCPPSETNSVRRTPVHTIDIGQRWRRHIDMFGD